MAEKTKGSGPAFPVNGPNGDSPGMTLRDWFAGQIVIGLEVNIGANAWGSSKSGQQRRATYCYELADAMLAERNKQ